MSRATMPISVTSVQVSGQLFVIGIAAGALLGAAVGFRLGLSSRRRRQSDLQCEAHHYWQKLNNEVIRIAQRLDAHAGLQGRGTHSTLLAEGMTVRVKPFDIVKDDGLWDILNNRFCDRVGVLVRVDTDGDVRVDFDEDGDDFLICDHKFFVPEVSVNSGSSSVDSESAVDLRQILLMSQSLGRRLES